MDPKINPEEPELNPSETTLGTSGSEFLTEEEQYMISGESQDIKKINSGQGPLDNPVIHRSYTERKFAGDTATPISEPVEPRQVINPQGPDVKIPNSAEANKKAAEQNYKDRIYADQTLGEKPIARTGGNPAVQTMTTKERTENLEMTVSTAIESYAKAKEWIGSWLTISDSNLIKRQNDGKTPPDWAVLYDKSVNEVMTLRQFIAEGNRRIELACKTDEAFKAKVKPILMAEFDRRNWIISPKQNGFIMFGADLLSMGQKLFTLKMNMLKVINQADKEFEEFQKSGHLTARQLHNIQNNYFPTPPPPINYSQPVSQPQQPSQQPGVQPVTNPQQQQTTSSEIPAVKQQLAQEIPLVKDTPMEKKTTETVVLPLETEDEVSFVPPAD